MDASERRSELRRQVKRAGFPKDKETLSVWFLHLYERDFDHDQDGYFTGKDSADSTLESMVKDALR